MKPLAETLGALLEDSFEGARNEAATCLGILMKMVGERPLNALMEGLADVRKAKVKESYEKAVVKCKSPGSGPPKVAPAPKPTAKKAPVVAKSAVVDENEAKNPVNQPPTKAPVRMTLALGKCTNRSETAQKTSGTGEHGCFRCKETVTASPFQNSQAFSLPGICCPRYFQIQTHTRRCRGLGC